MLALERPERGGSMLSKGFGSLLHGFRASWALGMGVSNRALGGPPYTEFGLRVPLVRVRVFRAEGPARPRLQQTSHA